MRPAPTSAGGRFLDAASETLPTVVLGADAASRLGISPTTSTSNPRVWLGGEWFAVIGILEPAPLAPDLDSAALIGYPVAEELFDTTRSPSTLFVRTTPDQVEAVRAVLARSVDPQTPDEVEVSRPSDALEARAATDEALRNLLLGLGAVALVVGGVGITNVMVISVLERRGEIGVRRAMGAKRLHIAGQFLAEATMLATLGGVSRCRPRRDGHGALRPQPGMARRRARRRPRRRRRGGPRPSASSPASRRRSAPPASTPPTPCGRPDVTVAAKRPHPPASAGTLCGRDTRFAPEIAVAAALARPRRRRRDRRHGGDDIDDLDDDRRR